MMKHVKLFEQFLYEAETPSGDAFDKFEKIAKQLLDDTLKHDALGHEIGDEMKILKWQIIIAKKKDDDSADKLEKKREALKARENNEFWSDQWKQKIWGVPEDAEKDPEMKAVMRKLGRFEYGSGIYGQGGKTDFLEVVKQLAHSQTEVKAYAYLISELKKIDQKEFTDNQKKELDREIRNNQDYLNTAKASLEREVKSVNDGFAKLKELKSKAEKKSGGSKKKTEAEKIEAEYEKKIEALQKKADRHYSKEQQVSQEDIEETLIPLLRDLMGAKIQLAETDPEKKSEIEKAKKEIEDLEKRYSEEYSNYERDVDMESKKF